MAQKTLDILEEILSGFEGVTFCRETENPGIYFNAEDSKARMSDIEVDELLSEGLEDIIGKSYAYVSIGVQLVYFE